MSTRRKQFFIYLGLLLLGAALSTAKVPFGDLINLVGAFGLIFLLFQWIASKFKKNKHYKVDKSS